jgi:hypothetical protein
VRRVPAKKGGDRDGAVDEGEINSSSESWASGTWVGETKEPKEHEDAAGGGDDIEPKKSSLTSSTEWTWRRHDSGDSGEFTAGGRWVHMAEDAPSFAWPCMMFHKGVSRRVRYGIFLTLIGVIMLFVATNASVWASVIVKIIFEGNEIELPPVFSFTLTNTVHDMWQAKVYPLAIIIALFSGAWPYAKVLLMLFCWLCPVWVLPPRQRETAMIWLDALGKWYVITPW